MADTQFDRGSIRKLCGGKEAQKFRDHLLRLDRVNQTMRFGLGVTSDFIAYYAAHSLKENNIAFAYIENGEIRASAELILTTRGDPFTAKIALSVEPEYQGRGIGTQLMGCLINAAAEESIRKLEVSCLAQNEKMQHIVRKYHAVLHFEYGEVIAHILPNVCERNGLTGTDGHMPANLSDEAKIGIQNAA